MSAYWKAWRCYKLKSRTKTTARKSRLKIFTMTMAIHWQRKLCLEAALLKRRNPLPVAGFNSAYFIKNRVHRKKFFCVCLQKPNLKLFFALRSDPILLQSPRTKSPPTSENRTVLLKAKWTEALYCRLRQSSLLLPVVSLLPLSFFFSPNTWTSPFLKTT